MEAHGGRHDAYSNAVYDTIDEMYKHKGQQALNAEELDKLIGKLENGTVKGKHARVLNNFNNTINQQRAAQLQANPGSPPQPTSTAARIEAGRKFAESSNRVAGYLSVVGAMMLKQVQTVLETMTEDAEKDGGHIREAIKAGVEGDISKFRREMVGDGSGSDKGLAMDINAKGAAPAGLNFQRLMDAIIQDARDRQDALRIKMQQDMESATRGNGKAM